MNLKITLVAAAALLAPISANAHSLISDHKIHDRSEFEIVSSLQYKGINAERVEEWGDAIRVDAMDENGRRYMMMVDKDTLQPKGESARVSSPREAPSVSGFQWPRRHHETPRSLLDYDDGDDGDSGDSSSLSSK